MSEHEEMLRAAPTTEDGGEFVLFEAGSDRFLGQFHTAEETATYIKENNVKRPALLFLSMLKPHIPIYVPFERKKSSV